MIARPVRILLDNSIVGGAEIAQCASLEKIIQWGDMQQKVEIAGFTKKVAVDAALQKEIDAIVTVGRLVREGMVEAHTYSELRFESFRRSTPVKAFYALNGCNVSSCLPAIERSKFRKTLNFSEYISKGGKKDKKANRDLGDFNHIPFLEWLLSLDEHAIQSILTHSKEIGLSEFEMESFRQIAWFRFICSRVGSPENYPDAFHIWTAERNGIDVFLTLEKKLPNTIDQIVRSAAKKNQVKTRALRPIAFLQSMDISMPDDVPIEADRFYEFAEAYK